MRAQKRDAKGRFCKKGETEMHYWEGLKVPVDPKREWGSWMCGKGCCPGQSIGIKCGYGKRVDCTECIYSKRYPEERRGFYEQYYGKWSQIPPKTPPKLTVEVFNRPDCPEWAQWAAVDANGLAYFYENRPYFGLSNWYDLEFGMSVQIPGGFYDISNCGSSLIQRPPKELPKLTQTAFHCPDCPKEAAKLKVFPANHVVALDKNDKVLSVMELQCKEGEIKKTEAEWHHGWYFIPGIGPTYSEKGWLIPPSNGYQIKVQYLPEEALTGKAVTSIGWKEDYLIKEVRYHSKERITVVLTDVQGQIIPVLMEDFIQFYRFAGTNDFCCKDFKTE